MRAAVARRHFLLVSAAGKLDMFDKLFAVPSPATATHGTATEQLSPAQLVRFLLEKPLLFSMVLAPIDTPAAGRSGVAAPVLTARVHVSIRPLAFVAHTLTPLGGHLEDLFRTLGVDTGGASFLDARTDAPLDVAPPRTHTLGETTNRIVDALEAASELHVAEVDAPASLNVALQPFQRRTLAWMRERERRPSDVVTIRPSTGVAAFFYANQHLQRHQPARGGFVMQEMGMGKTVEALALALATRRPALATPLAANQTTQVPPPKGGTLVLTPSTLFGNWMAECSKLLPPSVRVLLLDSANKKKHGAHSLCGYDIVITSYSMLKASPVVTLRWHRVVLDEAQEVRNADSAVTKAVASIQASRRWALTGTPFVASHNDLHGQLAALHILPFSSSSLFHQRLSPLRNGFWVGGTRVEADGSVQPTLHLLSHCAIRHCKSSQSGIMHVQLPPLTIDERTIDPCAEEAAFYEALAATCQSRIERFYRQHSFGECGEINSLLLKLRLACAHPSLTRDATARLAAAARDATEVVQTLGEGWLTIDQALRTAQNHGPAALEYSTTLLAPFMAGSDLALPACGICLDEMVLPVLTPCRLPHMYCGACMLHLKGRSDHVTCPTCRTKCSSRMLRALMIPPPPDAPAAHAGVAAATETTETTVAAANVAGDGGLAEPPTTIAPSAKLEALLAALHDDLEAHPQSIVFTHFSAAQKLICERLAAEGIRFVQIGSGVSQRQRAKALNSFKSDVTVRVFVLSVKAAAVGLTLTCASRLFLYEPGLNLAAEQQAIGRVHRFGQQRPVQVVKLALRSTLEMRILELNRSAAPAVGPSGGDPLGGAAPEGPLAEGPRGEQKVLDTRQLVELIGGKSLPELHQLRAQPQWASALASPTVEGQVDG